MKIIWSDFAAETLKDIYDYYKEAANEIVARKIKGDIFSTTAQLINHPESGQIEDTLLQLNERHRYLVSNNFKIVYKKIEEGVLITDIFDTRQHPTSINNPKRNPKPQ
ncbi:type II toxin-antitoxin system RelE/ParE family toxin [Williamwhitmania taraxaci]|uniref:Plasmid stabilization system protein ParE n=1 Tax=Williamwhitmania taraxaci TaxID=1640674 RepID=A0A1G6HSV5_9BACT|nr:type II toxin-antitoxin system RelE/ParE family toxin [Williamwhitmania taraxaci]SDB97233.1 Plasmid stabilization system protein ParE [Williamwhitmania taraxaci]